jgi:D-alanine-D-alanine ligase
MGEGRNIAILAGGFSSEREVSLKSGEAVERGLAKAGYHTTLVDVRGPEIPELALPFDAAFIALHGKFGEDGTLQEMLDAAHLPYTGCGPQASRLAMDKILSKEAFQAHHVSTAPYLVVHKADEPDVVLARATALGWPLVVKPPAEGSSVGVTIARDPAEFAGGVDLVFKNSDVALVEKYIKGRELTVGILGCAALPIVEVVPAREFYDYTAKYESNGTQYVTEVDLPSQLKDRAQIAALEAFKALGCRDMARVDLILDEKGHVYVLEVNTIPGFTEKSLLPKAAATAGISFEALCDRIIRFALSRASAVHSTSGNSVQS